MTELTQISSQASHPLLCEETRWLLDRMAVDDPSVIREEGDALALHVVSCGECGKAFYRSVDMNEEVTFKPEDEVRHAEIERNLMTVEEGWQDLFSRCPDLADAHKREQRQQHIPHRSLRHIAQIVAMVACLAVVTVGAWLQFKPTSPFAPQGYAGQGKKSLPHASPCAVWSNDDQLASIRRELWRLPAPLDRDTLVYAVWRSCCTIGGLIPTSSHDLNGNHTAKLTSSNSTHYVFRHLQSADRIAVTRSFDVIYEMLASRFRLRGRTRSFT
jgi:hypothetical protein